MKRIALIRNSYAYDFGGAELFPINLANILNNSGFDAVMFSSNNKTLQKAKSANIHSVKSPWWSSQNISGKRLILLPVYMLWIIFVTFWYVVYFVTYRIDVVHPQSRDDFIAATLAGKLLNKKIIWSDHADLKHIYKNHKIWYKNPIGKIVYIVSLLASHVLIESNSEKKLIEESLGGELPSNYLVIYIGVKDSYRAIDQHRNKLVFVSTSRLVKDKGIGELINAFKCIDNKNIVLKICGDGPDSQYFRSLAKGENNIEFLGYVNEITEVLLNSDVFVHPTYHEGFGLSLVEAEMCCLPIIASNVGSIPEIVDHGISGILIQPKDVNDLSKAIASMIANPELRLKMGKAGRRIYLNKFNLDKIANEKMIPLYEK